MLMNLLSWTALDIWWFLHFSTPFRSICRCLFYLHFLNWCFVNCKKQFVLFLTHFIKYICLSSCWINWSVLDTLSTRRYQFFYFNLCFVAKQLCILILQPNYWICLFVWCFALSDSTVAKQQQNIIFYSGTLIDIYVFFFTNIYE